MRDKMLVTEDAGNHIDDTSSQYIVVRDSPQLLWEQQRNE